MELVRWLEKRGFKNKFHNNESRDIVDETILNIQTYNQRLYTNESSISEEINRRIEMLRTANELENSFDLKNENVDTFEYDNEGYVQLLKEEASDFLVDIDDEEVE